MVLYPNKLPESERVCSGICNLVPAGDKPSSGGGEEKPGEL